MRIGYAFWGFLADRKLSIDGEEVSSPDGNATYSWSIVHEAVRRGHTVVPLHERRDVRIVADLGARAFRAFSRRERWASYQHLLNGSGRAGRSGWLAGSDRGFPELDLVLLEWRWPIPGRNTLGDVGSPLYQRDLERQGEILRHYTGMNVPIVVWDLDHKLTEEDERAWEFRAVFETAVSPRSLHIQRTRVEPPFLTEQLVQHPTPARAPTQVAAYVGSRYERDDVLDEFIGPLAQIAPHRVHLYGKWEPADDVRRRWPNVMFHGRMGVQDFHLAYRNAAICPLLAKRSYMENGFITPRPWEALLFGSIPVGLRGHLGISAYSYAVAGNAMEMLICAAGLMERTQDERHRIREGIADRLRFMDARYFVDALEGAYARTSPRIARNGQEDERNEDV